MKHPKRWFRKVKSDLGNLPDALEWYEEELKEAFEHTGVSGSLFRANQEQPGLVAYYDAMQADLDLILDYCERQLRMKKGAKTKEWADNPPTNGKLTATDIKLLLEEDPEVAETAEIVEEVRYFYKQYSAVMKALEQRGYTLSSISKLRAAGIDEIDV